MLTPDDVHSFEDLIEYCHQQTGAPYPKVDEKKAIGGILKQFFEQYPEEDHRTFTDVVKWGRIKRKRYSMLKLFGCWRYAYQDGFMTIMEMGGTNDDRTLVQQLANVNNEQVVQRMLLARGARERDAIYQDYLQSDVVEPVDPVGEELEYGLVEGQMVRYRATPIDPVAYGTVKATPDGAVLIRDGADKLVRAYLVDVRKEGDWVALQG